MARKVLVTGATGRIGRPLCAALCRHPGLEVRAFVRDPERARDLEEAGAELAVGAFEDKEAVSAAQKGVDTIVLVTSANPDAEAQVKAALAPAKRRKVRKIVRLSALKADPDGPTDNTRQHGHSDAAIGKSGLAHTIVRPHWYLQNLLGYVPSIRADDVFYAGMGKARLGMVDTRDVADVLEKVVTGDAFDGEVLDLTGPAAITMDDVARAISEATGRPVTHVPVPPEAVHTSVLRQTGSPWLADLVRDYAKAYGEGWGDFTTDHVQRVLGRPPRSIYDFVKDVFVPAFQA